MQREAFLIAQKWLSNNYRLYNLTQFMWEKYNVVTSTPEKGYGGEYEVQVIILFLKQNNKNYLGRIWVDKWRCIRLVKNL